MSTSDNRIFYLCDPAKNTTCKKNACDKFCGDSCKLTTNPAFAKDSKKYHIVAEPQGDHTVFMLKEV